MYFVDGDNLKAKTFDPFTHVYSFDAVFNPDLVEGIVQRFNDSKSSYLVSSRHKNELLRLGKQAVCIESFSVALAGSKNARTLSVWRRTGLDDL